MSAELMLTKQKSIGLSAAEQALVCGNLASLSEEQRLELYGRVCESLGLNPLTKPFDYIVLNDKLTLYAKRDCTDQMRRIHGVSVSVVNRELIDGVYVVTARATTPDGRSDESTGAVALVKEDGAWETSQSGKRYFKGNGTFRPLDPETRANKLMTAETKAKRRATLSICGLGFLDETEADSLLQSGAASQQTAVQQTEPVPHPATGHISAEDADVDEVNRAAQEEADRRAEVERQAAKEAAREHGKQVFAAFATTADKCGFARTDKEALIVLAKIITKKDRPTAQDLDNARLLRNADWGQAIDLAHEQLGMVKHTATAPQEDQNGMPV